MIKSIFLLILFFLFNNLMAQDVVLTISGEYEDHIISLDSILILNSSNNTELFFDNLSDHKNYQINLTNGKLEGTTEVRQLERAENITIAKNTPGNLKLNYNESIVSRAKISVYNLKGQKVYIAEKETFPGINSFDIRIGKSGIFIVHFKSKSISKSFKVVGSEVSKHQQISIETNTKNNPKSGLSTFENDFHFSNGDIIRLTAFKKGIQSQVITETIFNSTPILCEFINKENKGLLFDHRDSTVYKWVMIGEQIWMAENLNYKADSGYWTKNYDENTNLTERYYNWETAKTICPEDWHLPSDQEWEQLAEFVSETKGPFAKDENNWFNVGKYLRATYGWNDERNGTDEFGFSGLPRGIATSNTSFFMEGDVGQWWSATDTTELYAYSRLLDKATANFLYRTETGKRIGLSVRCIKDKDEAPILTKKINQFIFDSMDDVYLWYNLMPEIDIRYEFDSKEYFNKILFEEDRWSFVTDDIQSLEDSFQGKEKTFGYSLVFSRIANTGKIFAIVEFVYPNTAADEVGLKRGDIILQLNNADIEMSNYRNLLENDSISITLGEIIGGEIFHGESFNLASRDEELNPVLIKKVIDHSDHKIGYLFYTQFISKFNSSLDSAFQYFIDQEITDLIVDLRYNSGGQLSAAQHLCSSVAPVDVVNSSSTFVRFQWNDKYQQYWEQNNQNQQLERSFLNDIPIKMGLEKLYILTGPVTASASELTIAGLKPYMEIITVGETTFGKYTASITLKPEDIYDSNNYYQDFKNWGIQPIVLKYANSQGVTDFKTGFAPDIEVQDDLFSDIQLGEIQEPLLKKAIEDITGTEIMAIKKGQIQPEYFLFERGFSKFDKNKKTIIVDFKIR